MGGKKKMNRILGTVVALAGVLAFSTASNAAIITINVSGTGSANTVSQFAPPVPGYFILPFSVGSSVTIDTDANGDSVVGDVALVSGTLGVNGTTPLGALGSITTSGVTVTMTGGTGVLTGDDILWDLSGPTYLSSVGTFSCAGAICGILQFPPGTPLVPGAPYPIAVLPLLTGASPVNPMIMGTWDLDASLTSILGSSRATFTLGGNKVKRNV
jgi:hypothetical protein